MNKDIVYQKCQRCNRILKSDKAKKRGFGDHCWRLHNIDLKKHEIPLLDRKDL